MSGIAWLWMGVGFWIAASVPVAVLVGRVVRNRDGQVPRVRTDHPGSEPVVR